MEWNNYKQFSFVQVLLAFACPSAFAFVGFRFVLPDLVDSGLPQTLWWGIVASVMLAIFCVIGVAVLKKEARENGISFKERLLVKKNTGKQWMLSLGILVVGLVFSMAMNPLVIPFSELTGLAIPDYMPFWLNPSIDPMNTPMEVLSPNLDFKGNYLIVVVMMITLLLNIFVEELYFRAWLLPKMQGFVKFGWVLNAILFALYHTFQLWLFPVLIVVSLATTLSVQLTKSILPAFTIHIVVNFLLAVLGILALVFG